MSTPNLLELDNEIIENNFIIKEKDLLIWPLVRWNLLSYLKQKEENIAPPHARHMRLSLKNFRFLYFVWKFRPHRLRKTFNILLFCSARGRINDRNFNRDADYFSAIEPNTLVIDAAYRGDYFIPDDTDKFATREYGQVKAILFSQIKKLFSRKKNKDIERFISFLKTKNIEMDVLEKVRKEIYRYYYIYDFYRRYILKIINKLKPKLIFIRGATYGAFNSMLLKIANDSGIFTGELQHGSISEDHLAYNYSEKIINNEIFKDFFPDFLLTFGDYWNDKIRMPSKKITIGNPHFYESIKRYKKIEEQEKTILIISQGTITDKFVDIAKYLAREFPDYEIIFKLHPGEVPFEKRYSTLYDYENISVVKSGDIYDYCAKSENIVACYSTAIFEALGFNKNLFILDNDLSRRFIPEEIGMRFKDKKDINIKAKNLETNYNLEDYFNPNWRENYRKFLKEEISLKNSIK